MSECRKADKGNSLVQTDQETSFFCSPKVLAREDEHQHELANLRKANYANRPLQSVFCPSAL